MMLNPKTLEAMRALEERILNSLLAERHGRVEDPNYAAASEHADEVIGLAARDLVDAINAARPYDWPVGWACGEVGTGWPNGTDGGPVNTEPCRFRPDHDGDHDWAIAEAAAEAAEPAGYIVLLRREDDRWTDNWDGEVHASRPAGDDALAKAKAAGYEAILTAATPVAKASA